MNHLLVHGLDEPTVVIADDEPDAIEANNYFFGYRITLGMTHEGIALICAVLDWEPED